MLLSKKTIILTSFSSLNLSPILSIPPCRIQQQFPKGIFADLPEFHFLVFFLFVLFSNLSIFIVFLVRVLYSQQIFEVSPIVTPKLSLYEPIPSSPKNENLYEYYLESLNYFRSL